MMKEMKEHRMEFLRIYIRLKLNSTLESLFDLKKKLERIWYIKFTPCSTIY